MTTATATPPPRDLAFETPFPLTEDVFSRMVEIGLIPRDRRVFLRDGRLLEKMAKTKAHGYVGAAIYGGVGRRLPADWAIWPESTIVLDATNAPLPDFAVIRGGDPLDFAEPERYPGPADVGLVIEISVTSLWEDLKDGLEHYARAMIPVYWVVDVLGRRILIHSEPRVVDGRGEYARVEAYGPGQSLPLLLDGQVVALVPFDELLR